MLKGKGYHINNFKFSLLITVMLLSAIGLIVLQSMTVTQNTNMFNKQLVGLVGGLFVMLIVTFVDYHFICKFCIPLYIFNILMMLICKFVNQSTLPFFYGFSVDEARRWIHVGYEGGGLDIMPSEITKIVLILCLAKMFTELDENINKPLCIIHVLIVTAIPVYLVFDQPDLSTTIVIFTTFLVMYFAAGLTLKLVVPALAVTIPAIAGVLWYVQQDYGTNLLKPWQRDRILSIMHPEDYPDLMYQQNNAKAAIKAGGVFGKMITGDKGGRLTRFVPVVESDFIFSGVGEELGFVGTSAVVILFALFFFISLRIALNAKDKLGRFIAFGSATMITLQAMVNIGVVLSLLPNTGIPLPFMSSGLSSLLINFATIGLLLNVGLQNKDVNPVTEDMIVFGKHHRDIQ